MLVAQAAHLATQKNYLEASGRVITLQTDMAKIRGELAKLASSNSTLQQVMAILAECIGLLVKLKEQISKLVSFFRAMSNLVEIVIKQYVGEFLLEAEGAKAIRMRGEDLNDVKKGVRWILALV